MANQFCLDNCHECGDLIKTDTILAGPHHYHEQCFNCHHCGVRLGDNFYCVNSKNYCIDHKEVNYSELNAAQFSVLKEALESTKYFCLSEFKYQNNICYLFLQFFQIP